MKKAVQSIFKSFLVVLFLYYHIGNTAFIHTHVIQNQIITHSHPFLPGAHHGHTSGEIATIAWMNATLAFFAPLASLIYFCVFGIFILQIIHIFFTRIKVAVCSLRAPPYCITMNKD
ncbi:hypothetical protein FQ707_09940 [Bacteroidaceae bacterium HV4-6-C5C]|jgi:hypothetical protein|nr:hypothetical protein FQ707_09940 [Bacteroidaceae bacterium HV4-6-C5C]